MANLDSTQELIEEPVVDKKPRKKPPGEPKKGKHGQPRDPNLLLGVIRMRLSGKSWTEIGAKFDLSRIGARYYYKKWILWALEKWEWTPEEKRQVKQEIKFWTWEEHWL